jgi:hypothetical protein
MSNLIEPQKISRDAYHFIAEKVYEHSRIRLGDD